MYTTPETVRMALQKRGEFTEEELALVNSYISAVTRMIDRVCGWTLQTPLFEATKQTLEYDVGTGVTHVRILPSVSITSVKTFDDADELIELAPGAWRAARGGVANPAYRAPYTLIVGVGETVFNKKAFVEAYYGLTDTVPPDVAALATQQVVIWYNAGLAALSGASSDNEHGVLRYETPAGLSRTIHRRLVELGYRVFI